MFVPSLSLYGIVYLCNARAWWLMMADEPTRPPFWRTYAITVSGFSLNFVPPMVNVGGEPFKIAAVSPWLGVRRAAGSVICYQMLHTLAMVLSWLTALALGLVLLPREPVTVAVLLAAAVVLVGLTLLLLSAHRRGLLEKLLDVLHRLPLVNRLGRALEPRRELLVQMDEQIAQFYHRDRRRFFAALGLEYLARCIFMGEYWLIDRKSTRLNSSHGYISYAVFCLKKKTQHRRTSRARRPPRCRWSRPCRKGPDTATAR